MTVVAQMNRTIKVRKENMLAAADKGYSTATDLADYLVRAGVAFRDAHHAVAAIVGHAREKGVATLAQLPLEDMRRFSTAIGEDVYDVLTVEGSIASRDHTGGTAPAQVRRAIGIVRSLLR